MSDSYHFIGIGGAGMSAIAEILLARGLPVSGSDLKDSEVLERLRRKGAAIFVGHRAAHVRPDQVVIVSSAIPQDNEELAAARELGATIFHRSEMLGRLMAGYRGIAVAGSHGKTTTTSMVAGILEGAGLSPTVLIGGELPDLGGNAKLGGGPYLVAEADESDASFVNLEPFWAVVTNIEDDHLDYYGTMDKMLAAFRTFLGRVTPEGGAVLCWDDERVRRVSEGLPVPFTTYSTSGPADYQAETLEVRAKGSRFRVLRGGQPLGEISLAVPGVHSISNALAATAVASLLEIPFATISSCLAAFRNVRRRFEVLLDAAGIQVVDDYAHHPTEIAATLAAARKAAAGRVFAIFQPHRYTRTLNLYRQFARAFADADKVYITDIYPAGEKPIPGVTATLIVDAVKEVRGDRAEFAAQARQVVDELLAELAPGDMAVTLGAGDVWQLGRELAQALAARRGTASLAPRRT